MLSITGRDPVPGGFYLSVQYKLEILPIVDGEVNFEDVHAEYIFRPNPTDIDRTINIPNNIQPDQLQGFYVDVNTPGTFFLVVRGTTGQILKSKAERALDMFGLGSFADMATLVGLTKEDNGYTEYIKLTNFFYEYFQLIQDDPSGYAMIWLNAKDVEFYRVLPLSLNFPRTSARPISYGYAVTFQAIDETRPAHTDPRTAMDRMNQIRANINRWKTAIAKSIVTVGYLAQHVTNIGNRFGLDQANYVGNILNNMAGGLEGLANTSSQVDTTLSNTREMFSNIRERANTALYKITDDTGYLSSQQIAELTPPTRDNIAFLYAGIDDVLEQSRLGLEQVNPSGPSSSLDPASPYLDAYGASVDLMMQARLATELAPLPDNDPITIALNEIRGVHRSARAGTVGYLEGRGDELSSASYAAETYMLNGVRHPIGVSNESGSAVSLSYLTAEILKSWGTLNDNSISPALASFRKAFFGMNDPSTLSPIYKMITIKRGDTIYKLAEKHLGTWERWAEIALINGLQYPYISRIGGLYCKIPGDVIYIPTKDARIQPELLENLYGIIAVHDRVTLNEAFLGFDIAIDPTSGDAEFEIWDYAFTTGFQAFVQETGFVFEGTGGLTSDPEKGLGIKIGTKRGGLRDIALWQGIIKQWLSNDPRIEQVIKVNVTQDGGTIQFSSKVKVHGIDETQVVASMVRR